MSTRKPDEDGDPIAWLLGDDTGVSSKAIFGVMMNQPTRDRSVPWDPSDFGRCYRLLKLMPSWRGRLNEVAEKYPAWRKLVDRWDEVESLYERELMNRKDGMAPETYNLMKELVR